MHIGLKGKKRLRRMEVVKLGGPIQMPVSFSSFASMVTRVST